MSKIDLRTYEPHTGSTWILLMLQVLLRDEAAALWCNFLL